MMFIYLLYLYIYIYHNCKCCKGEDRETGIGTYRYVRTCSYDTK